MAVENIRSGKNKKVNKLIKNLLKKSTTDDYSLRNAKYNSSKIKMHNLDYTFFVIVFIMICFGLVMVLSASAPYGTTRLSDPYHFFKRQLGAAIVGFVLMFAVALMDYRKLKRFTPFLMICGVVSLVLVLVMGKSANNASRWLVMGPIQVQPSEIVKLVVILHFANRMEETNGRLRTIRDLLPYMAWLILIAALMIMQPHLSGTLLICGIAAVMMCVCGLHKGWIFTGLAGGILGAVGIIMRSENKSDRILNYLNPFSDTANTGWQIVQSLYAIASGGFFGLGLGQSRQKYSYLPEPYNDFIFAVICEELGFFGALLVIGLFIAFMIRGLKIAMTAPDTFGSLIVFGVITHFILQAAMNMGVATAVIPNTGISLPFFSYGGTALVIQMVEIGLVLSVSKYTVAKNAE